MSEPWILGIAGSHNGGACLLRGDEIVVAVQEERLSGRKRARVFGAEPSLSVAYCLEAAGIQPADLSMAVVCVQSPGNRHDLRANSQLQLDRHRVPTLAIPHHIGHAVSGLAISGFNDATIVVVDGLGSPSSSWLDTERASSSQDPGELWETLSVYRAHGADIVAVEKHGVPNAQWLVPRPGGMSGFGSLGGMYSAVAEQLFGNPLEAGQVMGLAPYGRPTTPSSDFFSVSGGRFHFKDAVPQRFSFRRLWPDCQAEYQDLAASVQAALEEAVLGLLARVRATASSKNLCFAGGVALNGILNERIIVSGLFDHVFIPPPAEDSGTAIGAAYYGLWQLRGRNPGVRVRSDALGRRYDAEAVQAAFRRAPSIVATHNNSVLDETVDRLCRGELCAWFEGPSEFGPRSLGQRSILADPRPPTAKDRLNGLVKFRARFRPFAPAILEQHVTEWFDLAPGYESSPFMLRVCRFKEGMGARVPAVNHVDGSGRIQTVSRSNGRFYDLLCRFAQRTGVPVLLNTSLNVHGEPIAETPDDAIWSLLSTGLDFCVIEDTLVTRVGEPGSVLDLVPHLSVDGCEEKAAHASAVGGAVVVSTPWGPSRHVFSGETMTVIEAIDGRTDGWGLCRQLQSRQSFGYEATWVAHQLTLLRRCSVIRFEEVPMSAYA